MLKRILLALFKGQVKKVILAALGMLALSVDGDSVEAAKVKIKKEIQRQKKIPGDLRKIACWWVDDQDAEDVIGLIDKLQASLA